MGVLKLVTGAEEEPKVECGVVSRDIIPLLEVDTIILDAKELYQQRGPLLYMSNPWWENTNRHILIAHLSKLYQFCLKAKIPYLQAAKFNNRTIYHMYPTARVVVRETSQSIGSTTLRAHFRNLTEQLQNPWSVLFELESRFWKVQRGLSGNLDSNGAIVKMGSKRAYTFWESLDSIPALAVQKSVSPIDFLDFVIYHTKPCVPYKLATSLGQSMTKSTAVIQSLLPRIRAYGAFDGLIQIDNRSWSHKLGLVNLSSNSVVPLGFALSREHVGQRGTTEDVVEIAAGGRYRTKDGSLFQGEYWFRGAGNPWLVVQVNEKNFERFDLNVWDNPLKHDAIPTVAELLELDPQGAWTRVWDVKTGRPLNSQAGRIVLKLK